MHIIHVHTLFIVDVQRSQNAEKIQHLLANVNFGEQKERSGSLARPFCLKQCLSGCCVCLILDIVPFRYPKERCMSQSIWCYIS